MPAIRGADSKKKCRRRKRDIDQVHADVNKEKHLEQYIKIKAAEDLPGYGQNYCVECSRWFESENNIEAHKKSKPHKKRLRQLKEEPYSQKEAEAAAGYTTDNGKRDAQMVDSMLDVVEPPREIVT